MFLETNIESEFVVGGAAGQARKVLSESEMHINSELLNKNKRVVTECYHVAVAVSEQNCISIQQGFVAGAQTFALKWGTESGAQLIRGSNGVLYFGD